MTRILTSANRNSNRDTDYEYLLLSPEEIEKIETVVDEHSLNVLKKHNPDDYLYVFFNGPNNKLICDCEKKEKIIIK